MLELSPKQVAILERFAANGFTIVAFPMYSSAAGIKKGNYAALLTPGPNGNLVLLGEPHYLIEGNLAVRVRRDSKDWFVWKTMQIEATVQRAQELAQFRSELELLLCGGV